MHVVLVAWTQRLHYSLRLKVCFALISFKDRKFSLENYATFSG